MMQKITPFLWFDDQAEEAVGFYTSLFENSKLGNIARYSESGAQASGRPVGSAMTVAFQLGGQEFVALNGGPEFNFTPAISFFVSCTTEAEIDRLWNGLSAGGVALMPLQAYPFSEKFGWVNDRYGVSWQINLAGARQKIAPFLMFVGEQHGKAEEALRFYAGLFENSDVLHIQHYGPGEGEPEGTAQLAQFTLTGQEFMAMDSNIEHKFTFTEAISFLVDCKDQEEVDMLWENLTAGGEEGPCGWLKDRYGVSWQIVPTVLTELMNDPDHQKAQRVTEAMLRMKKIDISVLKEAYRGEPEKES